ncbi:MAG: hypothetical protein COT39_04160 [Parcubacteria group bacterium CG08_land_8_20_14_0_20_48_21]|nr:MAG: hypothetical protein AUK21_00785 [Parcubacteria group bacterium CG2_30_48_51]PIS32508.1 MAG: hypothetical protein COT39_04160 [Parcubacteria group bacterium CG08_land_8_20_14_0_20_48_21]PIW79533.1 MAG: hypothetical protein COZ99_00580 [Parcubacteria group bacterium CG_4_8_14_3_um_filter_48_16]PIY78093.1 MAG: hypothetical protein COY83_01680 [Parcubacteria group bacterium CG_4_10_14_0_8_um_filter_48_154]PIZ77660.1 MAG: hypothetical protein COY03_02060 [bacterium CG_4_10_14_0_2_um_filter_
MFDLITVGDATLDTFVRLPQKHTVVSVDQEARMLNLPFGEKIPVDHFSQSAGGNAVNVATATAKLGMKTAIFTVLGSGLSGKVVHDDLIRANVAESYIVHDRKTRTNNSILLNYRGERTVLSYHVERSYLLPKLKPTTWVYLTSASAKGFARLAKDTVVQAGYLNAKLAFNPGSQQIAKGIKELASVLAASEVLFINRQEAERLVGKKPKDLLLTKAFIRYGAKIVVITDGTRGTLLCDGEKFFHCGAYKVKTIAQTGAGDAHAAGFIAALARGLTYTDALHWGAANAASVVQKIGTQEGLLNARAMEHFFRTHSMPNVRQLLYG